MSEREEAGPTPPRPRVRLDGPLLGLVVFLGFLAVSLVLFGLPVLGRFSTGCIARCVPDTNIYIWSMRWMTYAVGRGVDPFFSDLVWAPDGTNLAWVTSLPGPAIVMSPVTALFGPVVTVNLLTILAPALAAWAAFLLLREVTAHTAPSIVAAAVFAYSTYIGQHMRSHLNLLLIFFVPLAAYLVVRRARGRIGRVAFVVLLSIVLIGQFSVSSEIFATMTLFGGIAVVGSIVLGGRDLRRRLVRMLPSLVGAYVVTTIVAAPFLVRALSDRPPGPIRPGEANSADLLSFFVPRSTMLIGGERFAAVTRDFPGRPWDDTAYVGIGLLILVVLFALERRSERSTWLLLGAASVAAILSLGPTLHVDGDPVGPMPGRALTVVPLLQHALPERFPMYLFLALSVIAALWLSRTSGRWAWARYGLVAIGVVLLLPAQVIPSGHATLDIPPFFTGGSYRTHLEEGENVLVIARKLGRDLLFQARSDMRFRLARTYLGPVRPEGHPGLRFIPSSGRLGVTDPGSLRRFLDARDVGAIVVEEPAAPEVLEWIDGVVGTAGSSVGGVRVYQVPSELGP